MPNYAPIHLTINDKPRAILDGMQQLQARKLQGDQIYSRRRRAPLFLFLAGFPFVCLDLGLMALGYRVVLFSLAMPAFWLAALVVWVMLRRARLAEFDPRFQLAGEVVQALRDDLDPGRNFFGHLDLTGVRQPQKVARETQDALQRTTLHYRDEWLNLKTRLYDGNMLRLSLVRREKVRKSFLKRSRISGKMKMKPEKYKGSLQELKLRISVNPEVYDYQQTRFMRLHAPVGKFVIEAFDISGGGVSLVARSDSDALVSGDILQVLQAAYNQLTRKAAA
ncbi:MAG: hypothetical protein ACKOC5_09715 [Chloroflexota bacterium]